MKQERDFKGVWMTKELYLNIELSHSEKFLILAIDGLDSGGGAWASNEYLAREIGVSTGQIANLITKLKKDDWIQVLKPKLETGRRLMLGVRGQNTLWNQEKLRNLQEKLKNLQPNLKETQENLVKSSGKPEKVSDENSKQGLNKAIKSESEAPDEYSMNINILEAEASKDKNEVDNIQVSPSLEDWIIHEGFIEVDVYGGEELGYVAGYSHSSRKKPYSQDEVEKRYAVYLKSLAPKKRKPLERFDYEECLQKLRDSHQKVDKIIALCWFRKGYQFDNYAQWQAQFGQDVKYAKMLEGYTGEDISKAIELCEQDAERQGYEWKVSTVVKKIAEVKKRT